MQTFFGRALARKFMPFVVMASCAAALVIGGAHAGQNPAGAWQTKSQFVWDAANRQLVSRTLRVWSAEPGLDRDFYWEPSPGNAWPTGDLVEGQGTLTWRRHGAPNYDTAATVSTYTGTMLGGRMHGQGRLESVSGERYEGTWVDGLMDGQGHLRLANGDAYQGAFRRGAFDGEGVLTSASGEIYSGSFKDGQRHGTGTLTRRDGRTITAAWRDGAPIEDGTGSAQLAQWDPIGGVTGAPQMTVSITTDAAKNASVKKAGMEHAGFPITYRHKISGSDITIEPDDDFLLNAWSDSGTMIGLRDQKPNHYADGYDILYGAPAYVTISLEGAAASTAKLDKLTVDVARSAPAKRPLLFINESFSDDGCGAVEQALTPTFYIFNKGHGKAQSQRIDFTFSNGKVKSKVYSMPLPALTNSLEVDVTKALAAQHGDLRKLKEVQLTCDYDHSTDANYDCDKKDLEAVMADRPRFDREGCFKGLSQVKACKTAARAAIPLGGMAPYTYFGGSWDNAFFTKVEGVYHYTWTDHAGTVHPATANFKTDIILASMKLKTPGECGDGGPDLPAAGVPVLELSTNKASYTLSYPVKKGTAITGKKRFTVGLFSKESAHHTLTVVAELSDGTKVSSRPVNLLYFRPRKVEAADWAMEGAASKKQSEGESEKEKAEQ